LTADGSDTAIAASLAARFAHHATGREAALSARADGALRSVRCSADIVRLASWLAVQRLRQRGDAHAVSVLEPSLHALASAPNAATTMRWMHGPTMALLTDLLAGRVAVTHAALDEAQGSAADCGSVAFLRAALTHHGVLEQRDEASASFARWHQHATMSVVSTVDRAHVRAYATWQVAHQLATATPRRPPSPSQQKLARSQVRQAITLAAWLHMQHLQLSDLRQDLIDTWVTQGSSTRRSVRPFVSWLERCGVTGVS